MNTANAKIETIMLSNCELVEMKEFKLKSDKQYKFKDVYLDIVFENDSGFEIFSSQLTQTSLKKRLKKLQINKTYFKEA